MSTPLMLTDADYPNVLRDIPSPPKQLYWLGSKPVDWLSKPKVAIVGSRKVSVYGEAVTSKLASQLAGYGVVIISGLAYGVDAIAHRAALKAGGITVAVLAGGLDSIYPSANSQLADSLINNGGTLLSEYPAGTPSFRQNFIARNRIVSGLSDILLITEASIRSGTLHTAKFALEQGKTVMAVPGNITSPGSEGTNNLIKSGALPATSVDDILFALELEQPRPVSLPKYIGNQPETVIFNLINSGIHDQEQLVLASRLDGAEFSSALTMLEISGYIRALGAGNWTVA